MGTNRDTVERVLELWNRGGSLSDEEVAPFVQPDLELDMSTRVLNPATYSGLAGFRRLQEEVKEVWEEFRLEPEKLVEAGDRVVALVRAVGRGRQSGLEIDDRVAVTFTFRDGKVARVRADPDRSEALKAAGLASGAG